MLRLLRGKVNALVRTENAADHDPAGNGLLSDFEHFQLDLPVAEQDRIAFFHRCGETRIIDGNHLSLPRILRVVSTKGWRLRRRTRSPSTAPMRILGPGRSCRMATGPVEFTFEPANHADHAAMKRVVAVAEVEPRDVHAGADKSLRMFSEELAGPMVQTILVRRILINLHESVRESTKASENGR